MLTQTHSANHKKYEDCKCLPKYQGVAELTRMNLHCYRSIQEQARNHGIGIVRPLLAARPFLPGSSPVPLRPERIYLFFFVCQTRHSVSTHRSLNQSYNPTRNAKRQSKEEGCLSVSAIVSIWGVQCITHRSPVSQRKVFRQRVEREVASGPFGVVVGTGEACCRGLKATAGDQGRCLWGADEVSWEHLGC